MKKSERLNQELIFLSNKNSFNLNDLMEEFKNSKRTALRDIEELENMGLSIYVENGRYGGYKIINQNLITPIYFSGEEILAIFFALKSLDILTSTPFQKDYKQIREKLFATLPSSSQKNISKTLDYIRYYTPYPISQFNYLSDILYAIMHGKIVYITYSDFKAREIKMQIYELLYRNGIWFLEGYDFFTNEWGIYRCDLFTKFVIKEESNEIVSKEDLNKFKTQYDEHYRVIPFKCQLNASGVETFKKNHYPGMQLEYIDNTPYIIGKYNEEELSYLVKYLITFGENVKILDTKQLKEQYIQTLTSILEKYKED
ncbi:helix-turn-helix transcriptional regulator [Staphylococcus chromogenes]|uniref:helix-turn-helix transcriptional regulator n=1 Tax=Staphylococcus chromogenes TaxID=46126 RepID=UPI003D79AAA3